MGFKFRKSSSKIQAFNYYTTVEKANKWKLGVRKTEKLKDQSRHSTSRITGDPKREDREKSKK